MLVSSIMRKAVPYATCIICWWIEAAKHALCQAQDSELAAVFNGTAATVLITCYADVMRILQDTKLMQLQTNSLDAVTDILKALPQSTDLANERFIRELLTSITKDNRSLAVKSQAQTALTLLPAQGNDKDVAMSET